MPTGSNVTGKVNEATANALGLGKAEAPPAAQPGSATFSMFPVQGRCGFTDTFGYARGGGRAHLGTDIIAPAGNLIYAVADGKITKIYADYPGSLAGNGVQLTTADGTYYFYAHMTGINTGIAVGVPVKAGQILGTVGHTGDTNTQPPPLRGPSEGRLGDQLVPTAEGDRRLQRDRPAPPGVTSDADPIRSEGHRRSTLRQ